MSQLTVVARMKAKEGQIERAREILQGMVVDTRKENGCINYDLHIETDTPGSFLFYENWTSKAALDAHMSTAHFKHLSSLVDELFVEPPEIKLYEII